MAAPPVCSPATTPVVLTEATAGLVLLHVSERLEFVVNVFERRVCPAMSNTVGVMVCAGVPRGMASEFSPVEVARLIDATGQVAIRTGALVSLPAEAKNDVCPGVLAVARTWLKSNPVPAVVSPTTVEFWAAQVMGPMVEVMSFPLLVAVTE